MKRRGRGKGEGRRPGAIPRVSRPPPSQTRVLAGFRPRGHRERREEGRARGAGTGGAGENASPSLRRAAVKT